MDIVLKGEMDGIEAADQIRKRLDIPVIFLTAFGDENTLQRAKATEPFAYLLKPFKEKELHIAIEIALYKHETENKLKRMEQRLATILRSIGDAVIVSDTQGSITFMNSAAEALTGWKQEDALGKKLTDVYNLKGTESSILIDRSGRELPVDGSRANIMDEKGAISGEVIVFRDITEHKQAENVLTFLAQSGAARGEGFFQSLAIYIAKNLNMDYVCIDRLEGDGLKARTVAIYYDGKFEDNVSYALKDTPCGDVLGKNVCCFPSGVRHLFPKDAVLQEMAAESYIGITLWGHAGKPIGLIAVIGRRTLSNPQMAESLLKLVAIRASGELERKQAEEDLRMEEEMLSKSQEIGHLGSWELDVAANHLTWSDEVYRIFGLEPHEFNATYEAFLDVVHPSDRTAVDAAYSGSIKEGKDSYEIKHRILRKRTGEVRHVHEKCMHERDASGNIVRSVGMVHDITDQVRAEEELRKLNAELDRRVKERTVELEKRNIDLETTLKAFVGRELRMVELKEMVANLEKKINMMKKD